MIHVLVVEPKTRRKRAAAMKLGLSPAPGVSSHLFTAFYEPIDENKRHHARKCVALFKRRKISFVWTDRVPSPKRRPPIGAGWWKEVRVELAKIGVNRISHDACWKVALDLAASQRLSPMHAAELIRNAVP